MSGGTGLNIAQAINAVNDKTLVQYCLSRFFSLTRNRSDYIMSLMSRLRKPGSPLGEFFSRTGITQEELATRLELLCGYAPAQSVVSDWSTGAARPQRLMRPLIERATDGAVKVDDWDCPPDALTPDPHD